EICARPTRLCSSLAGNNDRSPAQHKSSACEGKAFCLILTPRFSAVPIRMRGTPKHLSGFIAIRPLQTAEPVLLIRRSPRWSEFVNENQKKAAPESKLWSDFRKNRGKYRPLTNPGAQEAPIILQTHLAAGEKVSDCRDRLSAATCARTDCQDE